MSLYWVTAVPPESGLGWFLFKTALAQGAIPAVDPALGFSVCVLSWHGIVWERWVLGVLGVPETPVPCGPSQPTSSLTGTEGSLGNPKIFGSSGPWVELDFSICLHSPAPGVLEMSWLQPW